MFFILSLMVGSFQPVWADSAECRATGAVWALQTDTLQTVLISKRSAERVAAGDLKSFCEWNRMDWLSNFANNELPENYQKYLRSKQDGDVDAAVSALSAMKTEEQTYPREGGGTVTIPSRGPFKDPWERSLLAPASLRKTYPNSYFSPPLSTENADEFKQFFFKPKPDAQYAVPDYQPLDSFLLKPTVAKKAAACGYFSKPLAVPGCLGALDSAHKMLEVHSGAGSGAITGVPVLKETLSDPKLTQGLYAAVQKTIAHMKANPMPSSANIFDDLQESFRSSGFSSADAKEKTFAVLAAISTGGPNFIMRAAKDVHSRPQGTLTPQTMADQNPNAMAMQFLAEAMVELDGQKMAQSPPSTYSLPSNVSFPCDSGKSYHFWLNAYLSRGLIKEGYNADAIRGAQTTIAAAYVLGASGTRDPEVLIKGQRFGSTENSHLLDLALASTGTEFGMNDAAGKIRELNADDAFRSSLITAGTIPSDPPPKPGPRHAKPSFYSMGLLSQASMGYRVIDSLNPGAIFRFYEKK